MSVQRELALKAAVRKSQLRMAQPSTIAFVRGLHVEGVKVNGVANALAG